MQDRLLVTGASGRLGRGVVQHLLESCAVPAGRIVAATRDTSGLADLAARGVELRRADFDDASSLPAAFDGIARALIISTGPLQPLELDGARLVQHKAAVAAAQAAGVGHLLYTSMPNPEPKSAITFAHEHFGTEEAIRQSGIAHTILRCGWYQENLLDLLPGVLAGGQWYSAAGEGRVAHVARDDIALAAAKALASASEESRTYTLTGLQTFTTREIAALAAKATGRQIAVVDVSDEELAQGLKAAGVPDGLIPVIVSFDTNTRLGGIDIVSGDVRALSGRDPVPLEAFLNVHAPALSAAG